jgi:hypothetical protein
MGVEERELLMPVHDIAGVVDIENDGGGLPIVGGPSATALAANTGWRLCRVAARKRVEGGINAQASRSSASS